MKKKTCTLINLWKIQCHKQLQEKKTLETHAICTKSHKTMLPSKTLKKIIEQMLKNDKICCPSALK